MRGLITERPPPWRGASEVYLLPYPTESSMDIDELMNTILPDFPDAQLGESDGEAVILTGVKMSPSKPATPRAKPHSKWFLQPCIRLDAWCEERGLSVAQVLDALEDSEIAFGMNDDTLVREDRLCRKLGIEPPTEEDAFMVSLGC